MSSLDESELLQFKDFIGVKTGREYVNSIRKEVIKDTRFATHNKAQLEKLFMLIKELKDDNIRLTKANEELRAKLKVEEEKSKSVKVNHEK